MTSTRRWIGPARVALDHKLLEDLADEWNEIAERGGCTDVPVVGEIEIVVPEDVLPAHVRARIETLGVGRVSITRPVISYPTDVSWASWYIEGMPAPIIEMMIDRSRRMG